MWNNKWPIIIPDNHKLWEIIDKSSLQNNILLPYFGQPQAYSSYTGNFNDNFIGSLIKTAVIKRLMHVYYLYDYDHEVFLATYGSQV
jgi:hypothetical protein